ncbi:GNAT family N-acetyltransferase [Pararhodospirillum photometricum]|nr:GNAT family N-acetyltransferase [Pararhodospirillum photometricum]
MAAGRLRFCPSITEVPAPAWDACAGPDNPFVSHAFLHALEASGSVGEGTGWGPLHAVLEDARGRVRACAPLYAKSHSYGEYVFDWEWARAYQRAGGRYYPKLQGAVPFTPVTGPRLLAPPQDPERRDWQAALLEGLLDFARRLNVSGLHLTFVPDDETPLLADKGLLLRQGFQYHWENPGYRDFDDFLASLTSRKRKALRKERERANRQGIRFLTLQGAAITERHWDAFDRFYRDTVDRKWGGAYLTRDFFLRLGATMGDRVVLVMGEEDRPNGALVCGALNLVGGDTLYGRTWGAAGDARFLHFEACYYRALDYAIAHGLNRVEAGAQGEHKISRGYRPRATWSAHWLADPALGRAVAEFITHERALVAQAMVALADDGPFRAEDPCS